MPTGAFREDVRRFRQGPGSQWQGRLKGMAGRDIMGTLGGAKMGTYGKYGGGAAAYMGATAMAPGITGMATMGAGAYFGSRMGAKYGGGMLSQTGLSMARTAARRGTTARSPATMRRGGRMAGMRLGRMGGGIAGAVGGMALAGVSKMLFGPSSKSNYGYR